MPLCLYEYFRVRIKLPTVFLVHAIVGKCWWLLVVVGYSMLLFGKSRRWQLRGPAPLFFYPQGVLLCIHFLFLPLSLSNPLDV
jgi:hypothetical protein